VDVAVGAGGGGLGPVGGPGGDGRPRLVAPAAGAVQLPRLRGGPELLVAARRRGPADRRGPVLRLAAGPAPLVAAGDQPRAAPRAGARRRARPRRRAPLDRGAEERLPCPGNRCRLTRGCRTRSPPCGGIPPWSSLPP